MDRVNIIEELASGTLTNGKLNLLPYDNKFEKWMLIVAIMSVIISFITSLFDATQKYSVFFLLVPAVTSVLYFISYAVITPFKVFSNLTSHWLDDSSKRLEAQNLLIHRLSLYSSWDIENTLCRVSRDIENMKNKIGLLVGVWNKLGIVPLLLSGYLIIVKIFRELSGNEEIGFLSNFLDYQFTFSIIGLVIFVYIGVFCLTRVVVNYEEFRIALIQAQKLSEQRDAIQVNP